MNTCGYEHNITYKFIQDDQDPFELEKEYWFSEWYPILEEANIYTPKSYICNYQDLYNGKIDKIIRKLPNKECFARLDTLSSKPSSSYKNSCEIIFDFENSNRTRDYFTENMNIIIREYVCMNNIEFRCFIHNKKLRAISSEGKIKNIEEVKKLVDKITFYTEYDSYCIDMTYVDNNLMVIEINTPVWLFACSGLFRLDEAYDLELLVGDYNPDIICYPEIRYKE
jgi:hypothetical protein